MENGNLKTLHVSLDPAQLLGFLILILSILRSISVLSQEFCNSCVENQGSICKQA